jgi:hypothetical protein
MAPRPFGGKYVDRLKRTHKGTVGYETERAARTAVRSAIDLHCERLAPGLIDEEMIDGVMVGVSRTELRTIFTVRWAAGETVLRSGASVPATLMAAGAAAYKKRIAGSSAD